MAGVFPWNVFSFRRRGPLTPARPHPDTPIRVLAAQPAGWRIAPFLLHRSQTLKNRPEPCQENVMTRKYIDCRNYPSEMNCTLALAADSDEELLEAAVQHAVAVHGHQDSPDFRRQLRSLFKDGAPPA
jgi:predicted small metal-binding protein